MTRRRNRPGACLLCNDTGFRPHPAGLGLSVLCACTFPHEPLEVNPWHVLAFGAIAAGGIFLVVYGLLSYTRGLWG